jgi:hypothetical protein
MEFSSSLYSKHNKILHNISGKRTSELGDMIDYLIHTYYSLTNNTVQTLVRGRFRAIVPIQHRRREGLR